MHPLSNVRHQGVRIPENQSTERAPSMTITNVSRGEWILVEWGNERGQKETSLALVIGGKVYGPPQYALWSTGFRPLVDALSKQVIERLEVQAAAVDKSSVVPVRDFVDVTGSGTPAVGEVKV